MKPERWQEIEELFHSALQCAPDEQANFLNEACGDDSELRQQVEALLASLKEAGDFIEHAPLEGAISSIVEDSTEETAQKDAAIRSLIGHRIGHWLFDNRSRLI